MAWQFLALCLVTLVGNHALPVTKSSESTDLNSESTKELVKKPNSIDLSAKKNNESLKGLQTDCEEICRLCNTTGKVEEDGSCTCLSENGEEAECLHFPRYKKELGKLPSEDPEAVEEKGKDAEREQRCLGLLGSSKDTAPAPANSLQNILGSGLTIASPAADVAEDLRKRAEAIRTLTITNLRNALEKSSVAAPKLPSAIEISSLPKPALPVSPFLNKPLDEGVVKAAETLQSEEDIGLLKEDKAVEEQSPVNIAKLEDFPKASVNFNMPGFNFGSRIPFIQSGPSIYNPSLRIPQLPANFPPQQFRTRRTNFDSFGNYGRDGRLMRSSGPFVLVQSPLISNPIAIDTFLTSSTDSSPVVDRLPRENSPSDKPEKQSQLLTIESPTNQRSFPANSQTNPLDFTHSIFKVADGDLTDVGKVVDSAGADKGIGSMIQGLIGYPKQDQITVEEVAPDGESNNSDVDTE